MEDTPVPESDRRAPRDLSVDAAVEPAGTGTKRKRTASEELRPANKRQDLVQSHDQDHVQDHDQEQEDEGVEQRAATPPALVRQHTFTKDEGHFLYIPIEHEGNATRRAALQRRFTGGRRAAAAAASPSPKPALQRQGTFTLDGDGAAELRAALEREQARVAALVQERLAAERLARERAARDSQRSRAALQDMQERLAATREALHQEKQALHRKLSAELRRALHHREGLWRQEGERALAQVLRLRSMGY